MAIPIIYNIRSVKARWTSTIVAVAGIAGTVGVFIAMLSLARGFKGDEAKRFKTLLEKADGWTRCDHLITNFGSESGAAGKPGEFTAKAAAPQLRSVT